MKNKKAISLMIAYVLLIVIAVTLSLLVYNWLKAYVPEPGLECDDATSLSLTQYICHPTNNSINIKIKNNGLFNLGGYIGRVRNSSNALYYLKESDSGNTLTTSSSVIDNLFIIELKPTQQYERDFDYSSAGIIERLEIQVYSFQDDELTLCDNIIIGEDLIGCN